MAPPLLALSWIVAVGVLVLNYPGHVLFVRLFAGAVRQIAADLRNALASRVQTQPKLGLQHNRARPGSTTTKGRGPLAPSLGCIAG